MFGNIYGVIAQIT